MKLLRYIGNFREHREELVRDEIVENLLKSGEWELVNNDKPKMKKPKENVDGSID